MLLLILSVQSFATESRLLFIYLHVEIIRSKHSALLLHGCVCSIFKIGASS